MYTTLLFICFSFIVVVNGEDVNDSWAGTNTYFLWACNSSVQAAHFDAMISANLKILRIFLLSTQGIGAVHGCAEIPDVEEGIVGNYSTQILDRVDDLMLAASKRGIKLVIALHDRWSLGCWRYDVYVPAFNITPGNCSNQVYNNPFPFYENPKAIEAFQNRIDYILGHVNPHFGLPWSNLSNVIFSVEPENEPMYNIQPLTPGWLCQISTFIKEKAPSLLITTGGAGLYYQISFLKRKGYGWPNFPPSQMVTCTAIDVIAIHNYVSVESLANDVLQCKSACEQYNKRWIVEEFGVGQQGNRTQIFEEWIDAAFTEATPWMFWMLDEGEGGLNVWPNETVWNKVIVPMSNTAANTISPQSDRTVISEGTNGVAWGFFNDTIEEAGYGILEIVSSSSFSDEDQVYCSGYLEGVLTHKRIDQLWRNFWESTFYPNGSDPTPIISFTNKTIEWTYQQAFQNNDDYWYQVGLVLIQLEGIVDGYNSEAENSLEYWQLYLLNMIGDLDDLLPALERQENKSRGLPVRDFANEEDIRRILLFSHCSSIVKPNSDFTELYASHEMWTGYYQMIQIYKHYHFNIQHPSTVSNRVSFASYAGFLSSEDDFYITESELVVMETTNGVYNLTIYDSITPASVMSWIRVIVANRMSSNGQTWVDVMARYNSGTYNNQWIIVDYKLVKPGQKEFSPNTLWIGSQMPGYFVTADVTTVLNSQDNVPYFPIIYNVSGYEYMYQLYGDYYSYSMCPRAQIFRKRESAAQNLTSVQHLMRYNDWENDPLSLGCPCNQIACRLDLAPTNDTGCLPDAFGAVNGKITATSFISDMKASIVGGPSHDTQAPFSWTPEVEAQFPNAKHYGQPTTWNFDWFFTQPSF